MTGDTLGGLLAAVRDHLRPALIGQNVWMRRRSAAPSNNGSSVYAVQSTWFAELFGTRVRYTGASLPYQIAGIITSAPAPLISTRLFASTQKVWPIAAYIAVTARLSLICAYFLSETYRWDLADDPTQRAS